MALEGLIIAAGAGSRLANDSGIPKPLRSVGGLPLITRAILTAAKAGMTKIHVVVGFEKEQIIAYLNSRAWPIPVETIDNPDWRKSNGISVLAAKYALTGNFVLMMSDHVFSLPLMRKLCAESLDGVAAKLAVDFKIEDVFDRDDATKVEVQNGLVSTIGKELVQYNAIDTGIFLMTPEIFTALESAKIERGGDCSLSDGVRLLAKKKRMGTSDIGAEFWQDVDTPESLAHAEKVLLKACRKTTDGVVSRNFNRYISLFISSLLIKTPVSANMVTFFTTCVGMLSGWFASRGTYGTYLLGAFLFKWSSILDGVDGELSKLKMTDSKVGQWLDTLSDNFTYVVFIAGTVIGVHKRVDLHAPQWISYAAVFGLAALLATMFTILVTATDSGSLLAIQKDFVSSRKTSFIHRVFGKIYFVIKRDFFAAFFLVLAVFDKAHWILFLIALATNIAWITILKSRRGGAKVAT